ncbi:MAG: hypothetical protein PHE67_00445 [Campylobacterales bacterium]|nr:hypothetical protein [Campylobacterales bacterium]
MKKLLADIQSSLTGKQFSLGDEKKLQTELSDAFTAHGIEFRREVRLDDNNIVDFMVDGLGIEVKIRTRVSAMQIYRQIERYCAFPEISALLLITSRALSLPAVINGKPIYILSLGRVML